MAKAKDVENNKTQGKSKSITEVSEPIIEKQAELPIEKEVAENKTAKAGKRSAKAIAETEKKQAKEERKSERTESSETDKPKSNVKPPRSRLERRSKNYRESAKLIETGKVYSLDEALNLATKTSKVKFDATVELHIRLNVDPRQADQNLRDTVQLPAGTGKTVRVAVYADADDAAAAQKAGADYSGGDEFLQQLDKGTIDFDVLIATPAMMPKLGKYARILGPKGLMPNPKSGTVTNDVTKAVSEAKAGRVEYRVDSTGIVHVGIGKVSFGAEKLRENASAIFSSLKGNKPSSIKGALVRSAYVTTSMGPSIPVSTTEV
jgi:large subunit ribosomal protein L1